MPNVSGDDCVSVHPVVVPHPASGRHATTRFPLRAADAMMPRRLRVAAVPPAGLRRPTLFDCRAPSFGSLSSARELPSVDFNMKSVRQCRYADLQIGPEAVASCCLAGSLLFFFGKKSPMGASRSRTAVPETLPYGRGSLAVEVVGATRARCPRSPGGRVSGLCCRPGCMPRFYSAGPQRRSRWSMVGGAVVRGRRPDGRAAAAGRGGGTRATTTAARDCCFEELSAGPVRCGWSREGVVGARTRVDRRRPMAASAAPYCDPHRSGGSRRGVPEIGPANGTARAASGLAS